MVIINEMDFNAFMRDKYPGYKRIFTDATLKEAKNKR